MLVKSLEADCVSNFSEKNDIMGGWMMSRRLKNGVIPERVYLLTRKTMGVAFLMVFASCVASGPTLAEVDTSLNEDEFWNRLYMGDLAAAEQFLVDAGTDESQLPARFALARATDDRETVHRLISGLPEKVSDDVLFAAAEAALSTGAVDLSPLAPLDVRCEELGSDAPARRHAICAKYRLALASPAGVNRCAVGCSASHTLALGHLQGRPVVMVTVADGSKVPFLVDTGASLSVLSPDFVEKAQARLVAGTEFEVGSSGGTLATRYATARLAFDELAYETVALALIELPLGGIGGIISPHDLFSRQVVSFDLSKMEMRVSPGIDPSDESHLERVPLLMAGGNPHLLARLGGRQPRPLLLDSGSDLTRVSTKLDDLGEPLTRKAEVVTMAAGGEYTSWTTQGEVTLVVGSTTWNASNPVVYERSGKQEPEHVGTFGIVGMDFLMGRTLVIDRPNRAILFDRRAQLPQWDVGEKRVIEIVGSHFGTPFPVREEVVERDADFVTLEIVVEKPGDVRVFRIRMQDSWNNRSSWLVTRPAAGYWRQEGSDWVEGNPQDVITEWLPAFMPFQSSGANAMLEFEVLTTNDRESLCSRLRLDATAKGRDATLSMWDCPGNVWRTTRLEVTDAHSGELLWGFHQAN